MTTKPLTPKQEAFVREYLVDKNATDAARRCGYRGTTVNKTACVLMKRPEIKRAITKGLADQAKRTLMTADAVLLRLQALAEKAEKGGEFHAAIRAVELIGKHFKLFTEKHEHGGLGGGPVQFQITGSEADH